MLFPKPEEVVVVQIPAFIVDLGLNSLGGEVLDIQLLDSGQQLLLLVWRQGSASRFEAPLLELLVELGRVGQV